MAEANRAFAHFAVHSNTMKINLVLAYSIDDINSDDTKTRGTGFCLIGYWMASL